MAWYAVLTANAPIFCVMPADSVPATLDVRSASRRVVFPWSTCPITLTTGGLGVRLSKDASVTTVRPRSLLSRESVAGGNGTGWDGTGRDGLGWDGAGRDGTGRGWDTCEETEWDDIVWDGTRWCYICDEIIQDGMRADEM